MEQLNIDRNATIAGHRLIEFMQALAPLDPDGEQTRAALVIAVTNGLLNKPQRDSRTVEERAEQRAASEQIRTKAYDWLKQNAAPSYDGSRNNARSLGEILDKVGLPHDRQTTGIVRNLLASEVTGWGVVDRIDGLTLYGKKAVLLAFRQVA